MYVGHAKATTYKSVSYNTLATCAPASSSDAVLHTIPRIFNASGHRCPEQIAIPRFQGRDHGLVILYRACPRIRFLIANVADSFQSSLDIALHLLQCRVAGKHRKLSVKFLIQLVVWQAVTGSNLSVRVCGTGPAQRMASA